MQTGLNFRIFIIVCIFARLKYKVVLDKEFQYYLTNKEELVKKHLGKYLIIKDEAVVGVYDSELEAYSFGTSKFALGTFLMQQCLPGDENYTQTFHSRVIFA